MYLQIYDPRIQTPCAKNPRIFSRDILSGWSVMLTAHLIHNQRYQSEMLLLCKNWVLKCPNSKFALCIFNISKWYMKKIVIHGKNKLLPERYFLRLYSQEIYFKRLKKFRRIRDTRSHKTADLRWSSGVSSIAARAERRWLEQRSVHRWFKVCYAKSYSCWGRRHWHLLCFWVSFSEKMKRIAIILSVIEGLLSSQNHRWKWSLHPLHYLGTFVHFFVYCNKHCQVW